MPHNRRIAADAIVPNRVGVTHDGFCCRSALMIKLLDDFSVMPILSCSLPISSDLLIETSNNCADKCRTFYSQKIKGWAALTYRVLWHGVDRQVS
jgi:hypothetical protein